MNPKKKKKKEKEKKTYMTTPITATSEIAGCSSKRASNSAGATWLPLTLINSCSLVSLFF